MGKKGYGKPRACVRMLKLCVCMLHACVCIHVRAYMCMRTRTRVLETMKDKFSAFKLGLERIPHCLGAALNP